MSWLKRIYEVEEQSAPVLTTDMLDALKAEESGFDADEFSEESTLT